MQKQFNYSDILPVAHLAIPKRKAESNIKKTEKVLRKQIEIKEFNTNEWHNNSFYKHTHRILK
jgi:hypothetical protein